METKPKRKQKPKRGKVIRVRPSVWNAIEGQRRAGETITDVVERLIPKGKIFYALPEAGLIFSSKAEARGKAIVRAVAKGKGIWPEEPIKVREIE